MKTLILFFQDQRFDVFANNAGGAVSPHSAEGAQDYRPERSAAELRDIAPSVSNPFQGVTETVPRTALEARRITARSEAQRSSGISFPLHRTPSRGDGICVPPTPTVPTSPIVPPPLFRGLVAVDIQPGVPLRFTLGSSSAAPYGRFIQSPKNQDDVRNVGRRRRLSSIAAKK